VKGNRLRTDNADGTTQIIDLDGPPYHFYLMGKKTHAVATFDDIRAAMQQAQENVRQQINQQAQQEPRLKYTQVTSRPASKLYWAQATARSSVNPCPRWQVPQFIDYRALIRPTKHLCQETRGGLEMNESCSRLLSSRGHRIATTASRAQEG